ncbi:hypothetical protein A1QO_00780 [Vibrio genomosp. F10 str. ZF-129]|uniref:Uncharacterized protein n=1 Tax=Vibrio genomosp. F10 str. ZF-129 TaxID=1187848 RepID=A0A1E5BGE2_9VIBR|nr:hypothetical protein A1QO_00780 [Vibrio genomosp. F10 str. ZF-129]
MSKIKYVTMIVGIFYFLFLVCAVFGSYILTSILYTDYEIVTMLFGFEASIFVKTLLSGVFITTLYFTFELKFFIKSASNSYDSVFGHGFQS